MIKRIIIIVLLAIVFGGVFGMKQFLAKATNEYLNHMPTPPVTITSATVKQDVWPQTLQAVGTVVAVNGTTVTTEVGGIVKSLSFKSGQKVDKGDVLITLQAGTDKADLRSLQSQAELAKTNLERVRKLYKLQVVPKADLDAAKSQYDQARARVGAQSANVGKKVIRAPFAGVLGIRKVDIGQYLAPGAEIVELQQVDPIFINFGLPAQYLAKVKEGLQVVAQVDAYPDEQVIGKVTALEAGVDPNTRNFGVQATFANPGKRLQPGLFAQVKVVLPGNSDVLAVPRTAISYAPYGNSVFVIRNKPKSKDEEAPAPAMPGQQMPTSDLVVRQRFVRVGQPRGDFVAVVEGLKAGDRVATSGLLKLRNDAAVIIDNEAKPVVSETPSVDNS